MLVRESGYPEAAKRFSGTTEGRNSKKVHRQVFTSKQEEIIL